MGWSVGAFIVELERACERGSVRDRGVDVGSIDSRENLRGKAAPSESLRDSLRRLSCSHLTGALVRPRRLTRR